MEKEKQEVSNRKINETYRAEVTRKELAFIKKTGNLSVDMYNCKFDVKALGGKAMPIATEDNKYMLVQYAVEHGLDTKNAGNCFVAKGAVTAENSKLKLRDGEELQPTRQMYWDKYGEKKIEGYKDKSYYVEVVNASKLEKFVPHNKEISEEQRDAAIKALEEKAFSKLDNEGTKDGKAWYDAAKDIAHVPKTDDKEQYMKDLIFIAASREVAKQNMRHDAIRFNREVSKSEQLLVKHFLAHKLRTKFQLGSDERNGLSREPNKARNEAINLIERDEKMLFNVARRGGGIANAMENAYFKDILREVKKEPVKAVENKNDLER